MMYINGDDEISEEEELDDDTVSLDDDLLAEVVDEEDDALVDEVEGFGLIEESAETEEELGIDEEDVDGDESLEDDAEDVEYDSFDDVDEMQQKKKRWHKPALFSFFYNFVRSSNARKLALGYSLIEVTNLSATSLPTQILRFARARLHRSLK